MNRAQTIADSFREVGVELTPERSEEVIDLTYALAKIAGAPVSVVFNGALVVVSGHRITFRKLES